MQSLVDFQQLLGDRYQLEGELGSGGQGVVFSARDQLLGRTIAVKFLRADLATLLGGDRFRREVAIAATLTHPNIVPVLDSGGDGDRLYYTMPLVAGESLRARLQRQSQLSLDEAVRIARDVAAAIDFANERGYIHRDIKPENILLVDQRALVLDFGIARAIQASGEQAITSGNIALGTPLYMSPEQAAGHRQIDGRTDIYSLGCVLYEMLAGTPPFTGATPQSVIARHMVDPPPSLSVVRPSVSPGLEDVVRKALAKVPADRQASGAELVRELENAARHPGGRAGVRRMLKRAGMIGLPALALAAYAVWPRGTLDPNKVMGFPLLERGGVPPLAVEQVEEAVAAAMQDTDPLRWLRARLYLGSAARSGLPADSATRIARRRGARYWLGGSLSAIGDSLVVHLDLYDAAGDSLVASRSEAGPRDTAAYALAFRAVSALLPHVVGRSTHVAEKYLEVHRPAAVAKWLAGEVAYRNARYRDAMTLYRDALAADSTLVPAALKGAMTAAWLSEFSVGDSLVRLALAREDQMPAPNRLLAKGLLFQFAGHGDSAQTWFRQAASVAPEWSEAWYELGEAAYHLWPSGEHLDSAARAAFGRSIELDPDFAPVVFHLAELAIAGDEMDQAAALALRHRGLSADTVQQLQLDLMLACVRAGPNKTDWSRLAALEPPGMLLLSAGRLLAAGGRHLGCAEEAYRAALVSPEEDPDVSRRWNAALGLHHIFVARGEAARARALADSVVESGVPAGRGLWVLDALIGVAPYAVGAREMAALDKPVDSMSVARLWWFGEWSAAHDDVARLERVTRRLAILAAEQGSDAVRVPARAMAARLLLARRDTAAAIDSLSALLPVADRGALIWGYYESLASERLLLARVLLAQGEARRAIRAAESFDGQRAAVDVAFLPASLEVRRQAAVALGDSSLTRLVRRRLAGLSRSGG